jgi:hypothetical protein
MNGFDRVVLSINTGEHTNPGDQNGFFTRIMELEHRSTEPNEKDQLRYQGE